MNKTKASTDGGLFFKIQHVNTRQDRYNPVARKIIDVNVYYKNNLVHSSVARSYLHQEQNGLLLEERKQQKQDFLRAERPLLAFPVPRLPIAFVEQIRNELIQIRFKEYLESLPPHLWVTSTQQSEDFPFYQRLDTNAVPSVQTICPDFITFYKELCSAYVQEFSGRKPGEEEEVLAAINFFRFALQVPYIPPFSVYNRRVLKLFSYDTNRRLSKVLRECLRVEALQQMFCTALTRRWEKDHFSRHADGQGELPDDELAFLQDKTYCSSTDLLASLCFQFVKLVYNCQLAPSQFFGTAVVLLLGSQCYTYAELEAFVVKRDGLLQWLLRKKDDLSAVYKAGGLNKAITGLEYYAGVLRRAPAEGSEEVATAGGSEGLSPLLAFMERLLASKQARARSFYRLTAARIRRLFEELRRGPPDERVATAMAAILRRIDQLE